MSRNKGTFEFVANFEVKTAEALDPRTVVDTKEELINKETWPYDGDVIYLYNGLIVSVVEEKKLYMLQDVDNALSADYSGWKEIGTGGATDIINDLDSDRTDAALSALQGKILNAKIGAIESLEYTIVKLNSATEGCSASYQLQKNGEGIGAVIDIPKDLVVSSGSVKEVTETNNPYNGAVIGDLYIELLLANTNSDAIHIPANKLVDKYKGSYYISIDNNTVNLEYDSLLSQLKTDIGLQTITDAINSIKVKDVDTSISNGVGYVSYKHLRDHETDY